MTRNHVPTRVTTVIHAITVAVALTALPAALRAPQAPRGWWSAIKYCAVALASFACMVLALAVVLATAPAAAAREPRK